MLDMGFIPQVKRIVRATPRKEDRQTLLFSATFTPDIINLSKQWTFEPVNVEIEPDSVATDTVDQKVYAISTSEKFQVLKNILNENPWRAYVGQVKGRPFEVAQMKSFCLSEFSEDVELAFEIGSEMDELSILNNLVALTLNMENNEKALKLAKESEILAESVGDVDQLIQSKVNIGSAYRRLGKLDLAAKYGEESLALSKKNGLERKYQRKLKNPCAPS